MKKQLAGLLARVSTADQMNGTSHEEQLKRARDYALSRGYQVVGEKIDVISGTFILARTAFNEYLEMMEAGRLDVIVVDIPDRLGRGDTIAKCELLAQLNGGRIEYAAPGRDDTTIEGMALKATDMLVSGIERINIRRRTMGGRNAWAERGRVIASPYRPYGYCFRKEYDLVTGKKTKCELVPVESEAAIVVQMFEWCVFEGLTTYRIAMRLTEMGIPTLSDVDGVKKKKRDGKGWWHKDTVGGILKNPVCKGEWRYRKNEVTRLDTPNGIRMKVRRRDSEETIPIAVPSIVSPELWEAAQNRLAENRKKNFRPTRHAYLLRGCIRCAKCGRVMSGMTDDRPTRKPKPLNWYYRCGNKYPLNAPGSCNARNLVGRVVEDAVWQRLNDLLLDEKALFGYLDSEREETKRARKIIEQSIAASEAQNRKARVALERLLDLYTNGEIEKDKYLAKKAELEGAIRDREAEAAELKARLNTCAPLNADQEAALRRLRAEIIARLDGATFEQKRTLLELLRIQCIYHDESGLLVMTGALGDHELDYAASSLSTADGNMCMLPTTSTGDMINFGSA
jgi:site-specific DNA recombinase